MSPSKVISILFFVLSPFYLFYSQTITIGTGTETVTSGNLGTNYYLSPFATYYNTSRKGYVYTAAEIAAAGGSSGLIQSIGFNIQSADAYLMQNFEIKMAHNASTSLSNYVSSGLEVVYSGSYSVPGTGWRHITLQTPFNYNGTDGIYIEICFENTSYSSTSVVYGTNLGSGNNRNVYGVEWPEDLGCAQSKDGANRVRPNIQFTYAPPSPPVANFIANKTTTHLNEILTFTDLSSNAPTIWTWDFSPSTVTYKNSTTSQSQNPQVQFDAPGLYRVTLLAENASGSDDEIKVDYINVIDGYIIPSTGSSSVTACSGSLFDSEGSAGNYLINSDGFITIYPSSVGQKVNITGTSTTESGWDYLYVYDGENTSATDLTGGGINGSGIAFNYTSSHATGALTVRLTSDDSFVYSGLEATLSCVLPCSGTPVSPTATVTEITDLCPASQVNLTVSGYEVGSGISYDWEYSSDGSTGWTSLGSANPTIYPTSNSNQSLGNFWRYKTTCSNSGLSSYSNIAERVEPSVTSGGDLAECGSFSSSLSASTNSGSVEWYAASSGGSALSTGDNYSPGNNSTTTYYIASSGCPSARTAITATVNTNPPTPSASASAASLCSGESVDLTGAIATTSINTTISPGSFITNGSPVSSTYVVSGHGGVASDLSSITLNISHTWNSDLDITLTAPDGSSIDLTSDNGSGSDNYTNTVFSASGSTSITSGTGPFTGTYTPEQAFSNLTGASDGTWTLTVTDDAFGDDGTLISWSINIPAISGTYAWTSDVGAFTSSDQNPTGVSPSETTTYTLTFTDVDGCSSIATAAVDVAQPNTTTINADVTANDSYVWSGSTSSTWSSASNWYKFDGTNWVVPVSAPGASDKVFVLDDASQACIAANDPSGSGTISSLWLKSGTSLSLSGTLTVDDFNNDGGTINLSSRTLDVKGNFTNNGTLTEGTGTVSLTGSSAQTVSGSDLGFYNLTVNNSNGVNLSNDASVSNVLTMTSGKTSLGSSHLTLGTGASISGTPSSSNMIVAAGTGELRKEFTSTGSFEYPVGTIAGGDEYSPVTLTWNSATFAGTEHVGVRVSDSRSSFMNTAVDTYINRNWIVEPSAGITSYDYNMELHYVDGDIVEGTYTEGDLVPVKYSSGTWYQADMIESVFTNTVKQGTGFVSSFSNVMNWDNLTTFSEFGAGGGSGQPLPVELTSFNGACDNGVISLAWETASENNSSHFDVEKSRDGENWTVLSTIAAAGTSNEIISYQAVDHSATDGNNYFRLRQVDIDGTEKLYDPINVSCEAISVGYFSSYPNPSGNAFQIVVNNEDLVGECVLNMVDAQGKVIERRAIEVKPGINMFVMNQNLNPGMYFLNVSNGSNSTPVIRHSIK